MYENTMDFPTYFLQLIINIDGNWVDA